MDMIKNLKVTPTSQILLADYRGDISLKDKDVSRVFMRRLEKKYKLRADTIDKIIWQDYGCFLNEVIIFVIMLFVKILMYMID